MSENETPVTTLKAMREYRAEARLLALLIVEDADYRVNLLLAARARTLPPAVEVMLHAYAYGKPPERIEVGPAGSFRDEFASLSNAQLALRARELVAIIEATTAGDEDSAS